MSKNNHHKSSPVIGKMKDMDSVLLTLDLFSRSHSIFGREYTPILRQALKIAATLHVNDFRKSPRSSVEKPPYIEHVLRVALRTMKHFDTKDINIVIAALVHDTVEDHALDFVQENMSEEDARKKLLFHYEETFGRTVAEIVSGLTNPIVDKNVDKETKRKIYHDHVRAAVNSSPEILVVKVSDFVDNAGSLHSTYPAGHSSTQHLLAKYQPLVDIFIDAAHRQLQGEQRDKVIFRVKRVSESLNELAH